MNARWLCVFALLSAPAAAQQEALVERAKASFKAGATAYAAGEYLAAIQALEAAYALSPLPAIAFSLAQAERRQYFVSHEREHLDRAMELFRRYIEQVPGGRRRADALDALSQLEPLIVTQQKQSVSPAPRTEARRTRLMITSEAPNALLSLDGAKSVASPLIREVRPGKHRVVVEASGFYTIERELTALEGELILSEVPLRERPSTVAMWLDAGAELYVDGGFVSHDGDRVTLHLPSGAHRFAVADKGHKLWSRVLRLERGKTKSLRVVLEPTRQRMGSQAFFIAGGAALGTSVLLSALTIRAENRAEEFLGRQSRGNVTASDLSDYEEAVIQRNRLRAATAVTFAGSAGFFLTGWFLHELDRPNPQRLYRTASSGDSERSAPRAARVSAPAIAPMLASRSLGASLRTSF